MGIKAVGTVLENKKDGKVVSVVWDKTYEKPKEWYFYTGRQTIWKIEPGEWMTDALIDFTFNEAEQQYKKFTNNNFWKERFGDIPEVYVRFKWTKFYESIADSLLKFKENRQALIDFVLSIADKFELSYLRNKGLTDIDPLTVLGLFNRGITSENRKAIASELASFLKVSVPVPDSFEAIPILNNQRSCFFWGMGKRDDDVIDELWTLFEIAILFADEESDVQPENFVFNYNTVAAHKGIKWNLTMGLYWIRPWFYPTLESQSQDYLKSLSVKPQFTGVKKTCTGDDYLRLRDNLLLRFSEDAFPVHSFPELSLNAWQKPVQVEPESTLTWKKAILSSIEDLCKNKESSEFSRTEFLDLYFDELSELFPENNAVKSTIDRHMQILRDEGEIDFLERGNYEWLGYDYVEVPSMAIPAQAAIEPYDVDSIINDGCFLDKQKLVDILSRLKDKKNLILQGPPGTGKTWLGKRLAYALIGEKQKAFIKAVQFHPNLSYEDFVRGWRPTGDGKLSLCNGPFMDFIELAQQNPANKYIVVIEEINRGNPAQIFGEMLTLLETDKRTPSEALDLSYRKESDGPVYIPKNLYVIGTMNIADRSLALVDLALRRRFAFINLYPTFGEPWRNWVSKKSGIEKSTLEVIEARINSLNNEIATDSSLGAQFKVGHSYFTPAFSADITNPENWFQQVVKTEIYPLLEEYWYDNLEKAVEQKEELLKPL
ncbi:MAG: AAA domain-containing protein [Endozoicomonadaceae bacterium]|nr:AAA domain-containing protein [Endozoicomonadaceae bacterium]